MGGSLAVLSDLEDLCRHAPIHVHVTSRSCLGFCGQGPNCLLQPPEHVKGRNQVEMAVRSFDASLALLRKAMGSTAPVAPEPVLRRARLKSDAMRLMQCDLARPGELVAADMLRAEGLLTEAITLEQKGDPDRLRELQMMRGKVRGRCALADSKLCQSYAELAIADFGAVIANQPEHARAYVETARILNFIRRPKEALEFFDRSLEISKGSASRGLGLGPGEVRQVERSAQRILERLEEAAAAGAEYGAGEDDGGRAGSGDGSGRWRVARITGISWDTCIYHLENHPPAASHPCPNHSWHLQARFAKEVREYTPVSTVAEWESGRVDLLVKTYCNGVVSKQFGMLQTVDEAQAACQVNYTPLEEQQCWVTLSRPLVTLYLPGLTEASALSAPANAGATPLHLALVVGGTGVAPALQVLREVADPRGAFGAHCTALLLYSSRTVLDVLLLDELRALEASAPGRITVRHTLSHASDELEDDDPWDALPMQVYFPGRHGHFASYFNQPSEPVNGPLRTARGQEAGLRGRVSLEMLAGLLPPPGPGTKAIVSGPQQMLDDVGDMLLQLGHSQDSVVLLRATTTADPRQQGMTAKDSIDPGRSSAGMSMTFADRVKAVQTGG